MGWGGDGDRDQQVRGHSREGLWGEAWKSNTHRPGEVFREALSSSSSTHPMAPPHPGWGPRSPQLSSTLLLCLQGPRGWEMGGEAVGPVEEDSGLLGEPMVVVVSEVELIQVPRALPASRAPHPAVIALQLFLSLPFLLCLFSSLHQDIEENLLKVFRVLVSQPA